MPSEPPIFNMLNMVTIQFSGPVHVTRNACTLQSPQPATAIACTSEFAFCAVHAIESAGAVSAFWLTRKTISAAGSFGMA